MFKKIYSFLIKIKGFLVKSGTAFAEGFWDFLDLLCEFYHCSLGVWVCCSLIGIGDMYLFLSKMHFSISKSIILTLLFILSFIIANMLYWFILSFIYVILEHLASIIYSKMEIEKIYEAKNLKMLKKKIKVLMVMNIIATIIGTILAFFLALVIICLLIHLLKAKLLINISTAIIFIFTFLNFPYCIYFTIMFCFSFFIDGVFDAWIRDVYEYIEKIEEEKA